MADALAPAILITSVYDFCRRLESEGILRGMHPAWCGRDGIPREREEEKILLGRLGGTGRDISIGLQAARATGNNRHSGRCPVCTAAVGGRLHLPLFDPGCGPLCPWRFSSRADYVAHRMVPVIGQLTGVRTWEIYQLAGVAPPRRRLPDITPTSLADALFGT